MKFTKEPPYELGELSCIINATIETLELKIPKLTKADMGQVNSALLGIGFGYTSSFSLGNQWVQLVDMFDKMDFDQKTRKEILKTAEEKYDHLKATRELK